MIPELGQYALILALAVALVQGSLPLVGAARGDVRLMQLGRTAALTQALLVILAFGALTQAYVTSDFSGANCRGQLALGQAAALQNKRRVGQPRGLDAAVGADPGAVRRRGCIFGTNLPESLRARVLAIQALIGVGFLAFLLFTSNPSSASSRRRPTARPQPAAAGSRLGVPSAAALSRLCRLLGAYAFAIAALLEAAVDVAWARWVRPWTLAAWCFLTLGIAHRQLVGLLHPGLGRLLVLGSGRERLADAVARRHRAAALRHRRREARRP